MTANPKQSPKNKGKENLEIKDRNPIQIPQFIALESTIGAISLLAIKSQSHKYLFISDLEWLVIPAVAQKQFTLIRNSKNEPIAFISWAKVSEDVEKRLLSGSIKLQPKDWNSGDKSYVIDVISPFAPIKEILKQLPETSFKKDQIKILRPKKEGKGFEGVLVKDMLSDKVAKV